jgi:aminoglycoside phosphotransferase (APT) family kinase protein
MPSEEILPGSNVDVVVRVGGTVRRAAGPHTPAVDALLAHLASHGFTGAPRPLGRDEHGRQVLEYLDGTSVRHPGPTWLSSDACLSATGQLIRRLHDLGATFRPPAGAAWQRMRGIPDGHEVICHNDLGPWNTLYRNGLPAAFVDWELAAPGLRVVDLAHAVWRYAPIADGYPVATVEQARRVRLVCDAYGLDAERRGQLVDAVLARQKALVDTIRAWAADGRAAFVAMLGTSHELMPLRDRDFLERNRAVFERALDG